MDVPFCTCPDTHCPNHPVHGEGCTRCIAKNLARQEIPTCFFRLLESPSSGRTSYTFDDFARLVLAKQKD